MTLAAKKREKAAQLRLLAASQHHCAAVYLRQAKKQPIYSGQASVCEGKAAQIAAFAAATAAHAARLEAEADSLDKAGAAG